jgi:hypothetical protein
VIDIDGIVFVHFVGVDLIGKIGGNPVENAQTVGFAGKF